MAEPMDPYREALVVESKTVWPDDVQQPDASQREQIEARLHAEPQLAAELDYFRVHSGFCRQITVRPADLERLKGSRA